MMERHMRECQELIDCHQMEQDLLRRVTSGDGKGIFLAKLGNQAPAESVEVSDNTEAEESQSHVDHVLRCERHRPQRIVATGPDNQSASLQEYSVAYASLSVREETRVVVRQIAVISPQQCTSSQDLEH